MIFAPFRMNLLIACLIWKEAVMSSSETMRVSSRLEADKRLSG